MVKRCIGIDIGFSYVRAVQILQKGEEFCIEKVFSRQTRRTSDLPRDIIRLLAKQYGFDRRAKVAISMPHDSVFFRNLETDFAGLEEIRGCNLSALEHNFPIQPDKVVAQVCSYRPLSDEKYSVLTAAVTRESLQERLNIAVAAKMRPNLVEAAIFAIHSAVAVNHPEVMTGQAIIVYIDESYFTLAVIQNNDILIVRNVPIVSFSDHSVDLVQEQAAEVLSREMEITWQKVFSGQIEQDSKIYLVIGGNAVNEFKAAIEEKLRCNTTIVDPYAKVKCLPENNGDAAICVAEGLALRMLVPDKAAGINFLEAENINIKPMLNLKKEFVVCGILVAAIAVISLVGLFMRLSHLEKEYTHIKNEIRKIFQSTLPDEKNIVSPLAQLEQKLESFQKDYQLFASFCPTDFTPLKVLHNVTANTPSLGNVEIDDILITTESARLSGTCNSFESVYQWQQLLREIPGFTLVDVQDVQKDLKGDAIHFTILISSAIQEQK